MARTNKSETKTEMMKTAPKTRKPRAVPAPVPPVEAASAVARLRSVRLPVKEIKDKSDGNPGDEALEATIKPAGQSVIKQVYRERYEGGSCGDALAGQLSSYLVGADGKVDRTKLQELAERNDVWDARYASLNPGMARMTVANRLRKLTRAGKTINWTESGRASQEP
jgi:hypothetical protein